LVEALSALVVVLVVLCGILLVELFSFPRRRRRVLVNLQHDEGAIEGLLWTRRGCWIVLKDARLLRGALEPIPVDGEVVVDKARIVFLQVL
jgi:hypothetical protein